MKQKMKAGFTLIELLVVTSIVVLLLLTISAMFMTFLLSNARTNVTRQIKAEGSEMIDRLEFVLRNARSVNQTSGVSIGCVQGGTANGVNGTGFNITDVNGNPIKISFDGSRILLSDKALNSTFVVSENPVLTCYQDPNNQKTTIKVQFSLESSNIQEDFSATVQLRNS
jgi:prepilin-type N-terminal cleavage/methylation domain-containing protein